MGLWRDLQDGPVALEQGSGSYRPHKGSVIDEMQGATVVPAPAGRILTGRQRLSERSARDCFT